MFSAWSDAWFSHSRCNLFSSVALEFATYLWVITSEGQWVRVLRPWGRLRQTYLGTRALMLEFWLWLKLYYIWSLMSLRFEGSWTWLGRGEGSRIGVECTIFRMAGATLTFGPLVESSRSDAVIGLYCRAVIICTVRACCSSNYINTVDV